MDQSWPITMREPFRLDFISSFVDRSPQSCQVVTHDDKNWTHCRDHEGNGEQLLAVSVVKACCSSLLLTIDWHGLDSTSRAMRFSAAILAGLSRPEHIERYTYQSAEISELYLLNGPIRPAAVDDLALFLPCDRGGPPTMSILDPPISVSFLFLHVASVSSLVSAYNHRHSTNDNNRVSRRLHSNVNKSRIAWMCTV